MDKKYIKSRVDNFKDSSFILDYNYDASAYAEEMREIWLRVIKQAVFEYVTYKFSREEEERALYYSAKEFLFNPNYTIYFGDQDITLSELLEDVFNTNIKWFHLLLKKEEEQFNQNKSYKPGTQLSLF